MNRNISGFRGPLRTERSPIQSIPRLRAQPTYRHPQELIDLSRVVQDRADTLRGIRSGLRSRQQTVGATTIRDPELESLRALNYRETDTWNSRLVLATAHAVTATVTLALGKDQAAALSGDVKRFETTEYPFGSNGAVVYRNKTESVRVALLANLSKELAAFSSLRAEAATQGLVPTGPAYNRAGRKVLEASKALALAAQKALPFDRRAWIFDAVDQVLYPYHIEMPGRPCKLRYGWRAARTLYTYHRGAIESRAIHLLLTRLGAAKYPDHIKELDLLLDPAQLSPDTHIDWQIRYRMYVDRNARKLLERAGTDLEKFKQRKDLLRALAHGVVDQGELIGFRPSQEMQQALRSASGQRLINCAGIDLSIAFAPAAESMFEAIARETNGRASFLFVPTHYSTMDQMYFLAAMPGFSLDRMFNGTPSCASIVARRDYMKNVPGLNLVDLAQDQGPVFDTTMITESDKSAMRALIRSMRKDKRSALIFGVGGRNPTYWHHNGFVPEGFHFLAGAADYVVPVSLINSTGKELRGGKARVVIGRPARSADFRDSKDALLQYTWQEQGDNLFTWE